MELTSANAALLFSTFSFQFQTAFSKAPSGWLEKLATKLPSGTEATVQFFATQVPKMREWAEGSPRHAQNAAMIETRVVNKKFELTLELPVVKVEDDTYGYFSQTVIPQVAQQAAKQPDYLLRDILQAGTSTLIYTGQNAFDTAHPISPIPGTGVSGTQDNLFTSCPLTYDNLVAKFAEMQLYKGSDGEVLGVTPTTLVVPPQLRATAMMLMQSEYVPAVYGSNTAATSQPNFMRGMLEVVVLPEIGNEDDVWYLADTSKGIKPLCFYDRVAPTFTNLVSPTDPNVFNNDMLKFGVRARNAASFGPYHLMARCEG